MKEYEELSDKQISRRMEGAHKKEVSETLVIYEYTADSRGEAPLYQKGEKSEQCVLGDRNRHRNTMAGGLGKNSSHALTVSGLETQGRPIPRGQMTGRNSSRLMRGAAADLYHFEPLQRHSRHGSSLIADADLAGASHPFRLDLAAGFQYGNFHFSGLSIVFILQREMKMPDARIDRLSIRRCAC